MNGRRVDGWMDDVGYCWTDDGRMDVGLTDLMQQGWMTGRTVEDERMMLDDDWDG